MYGSLATIAVDNQGVLNAVLQGRVGADDLNAAVGRLWLDVAEQNIGLHMVRDESLSNIADGPTHQSTELLESLGAEFAPPALHPSREASHACKASRLQPALTTPTSIVSRRNQRQLRNLTGFPSLWTRVPPLRSKPQCCRRRQSAGASMAKPGQPSPRTAISSLEGRAWHRSAAERR